MSNVATKAKKPNLSVKSVLNWILDHAAGAVCPDAA